MPLDPRRRDRATIADAELLLLGEASKRLSPELRLEFAEIPWKQMAGMRDHIVHAYDSVDVDEIWITVARDLPDLLTLLRRVQARVAADPQSSHSQHGVSLRSAVLRAGVDRRQRGERRSGD